MEKQREMTTEERRRRTGAILYQFLLDCEEWRARRNSRGDGDCPPDAKAKTMTPGHAA